MPQPKRRRSQAPEAQQQPRKRGRRSAKKKDVYEAVDSDPDEEKRSYRYDTVENYEFELPSDFEDEEIDEETAFTEEDKKKYAAWFGEDAGAGKHADEDQFADLNSSDGEADEDESADGDEGLMWDDEEGAADDADDAEAMQQQQEEDELEERAEDEDDEQVELQDDERYRDMLAAALGTATGSKAAERSRSKKRQQRVVSEAYPESEFHVASTSAAAAGEAGGLTLSDMMAGLGEARASLGASRKLLERLDRKSTPVDAPLPKSIRERQERKAAYAHTSKDVTKWQPIVKANREAPTLQFTAPTHEVSKTSSVAAIVDKFTPENDMEAEVAALLEKAGAHTAAAMAEAEEALAMKAMNMEEARARQERLAKMRHLLFYAELKAKRLAKIKSKAFHRAANKAAKKKAARLGEMDREEADRAAAEEAEFDRAKERLTLKHRNTSKWARRALKRGMDVMDEGTKAAIAEQLALGQELRRKIEGARGGGDEGDTSASDTSASDGEDAAEAPGAKRALGLSSKDRSEALAILSGLQQPGDAQQPAKGLFALPFMARALERRRQQAAAEAAAMLADMEGAGGEAGECGLMNGAGGFGAGPTGAAGRLRFGAAGDGSAEAGRNNAQGSEGESGDEDEDAEAKAQRLGRRLRGEAAVPQQQQRQQQQEEQEAPSTSGRPVALSVASSGPVAVKLPGQQGRQQRAPAAAASNAAANGIAGHANGTSVAAGASSSIPGVSPEVLVAQQREHQQWLFGGGAASTGAGHASTAAAAAATVAGAGPSSSAPAAFVPAATFGGMRPGYVYKRGPSGVGYYSDAAATANGDAQGSKAGRRGKKGKQGSQQQQQQQQQGGAQGAQQQQQDPGPGQGQAATAGASAATHQATQAATAPAANGEAAGDADDHMRLLRGGADEQQALIAAAFAGDDVVAAFDADKAEEVGSELPSAEVAGVMPGWGTWARVQKQPKWVQQQAAKAEAARQKAAAARKDANLKHVIISEKWDKKSAKFKVAGVPFPYTSKEVYEAALRKPLGRETNPDASFRDLTRPAVLKSTGVIIQPLRYSKPVEQYSKTPAAKSRSVATVAGGMPVEGKATLHGKKARKQQGQQQRQAKA